MRFCRIGLRCWSLLIAALFVAACGGGGDGSPAPKGGSQQAAKPAPAAQQKPNAAQPQAAEPKAAKPAAEADAASGSVAGRVTLPVGAPAPRPLDVNKDVDVCGKTEKMSEEVVIGLDNGVANAVVYLKGVSGGRTLEMPSANPVIDQSGCRYQPHVSLVPAGATIDIKNSDGILHNLHTYSSVNPPFNAAQPKFKKVISKKLDHAEVVKLTCDVHGWMIAWIVVHEHPYYVLTDENGGYRIDGVPPGEYEIEVWHEKLEPYNAAVKVEPGLPTRQEIFMSIAD